MDFTITLDPVKIAEQLSEDTGDDWTPDEVAHALRGMADAGLIVSRARDGVVDALIEGGK